MSSQQYGTVSLHLRDAELEHIIVSLYTMDITKIGCVTLVFSPQQRGLTALHDVCSEGHTQIALLLLAMGGYVQARTKDGWTCLMCTCSNGHLQLAQIAIAAGGDANASTRVSS